MRQKTELCHLYLVGSIVFGSMLLTVNTKPAIVPRLIFFDEI
jgi:hypothetical protein